jgi:hypothetical protein
MTESEKDWQFLNYEHNGETYDAMYEHSDGCVSARLFLKGTGGWSPPMTTHHEGPEPMLTARMLFRDIANQNSN